MRVCVLFVCVFYGMRIWQCMSITSIVCVCRLYTFMQLEFQQNGKQPRCSWYMVDVGLLSILLATSPSSLLFKTPVWLIILLLWLDVISISLSICVYIYINTSLSLSLFLYCIYVYNMYIYICVCVYINIYILCIYIICIYNIYNMYVYIYNMYV